MLIFRIDDVSVNTDLVKLDQITRHLKQKFPGAEIIYGVSLMVYDMRRASTLEERERPFPKIWNAKSDFREFYRVRKIGYPFSHFIGGFNIGVTLASHGLVHVDHRLLTKEAQELSIIASCSVLETQIFIPPFNKWNQDTEKVCLTNCIDLIKFESGWKHLKYEVFDGSGLWYFHTHDFTLEKFLKMFP